MKKMIGKLINSSLRLNIVDIYLLFISFLPILCISLATQEILPLHISAPIIVFPNILIAFVVGVLNRTSGIKAIRGFISGIVAVTIYDIVRLALVYFGLWNDFIPAIGNMLFNDESTHWIVGYLWRYILNAGCMGIAFGVLSLYGWRSGAYYGLFICIGLFLTLILSPIAQKNLFELNFLTGIEAFICHLIFGIVLGITISRLNKIGTINMVKQASIRPVCKAQNFWLDYEIKLLLRPKSIVCSSGSKL